MQTQAPLNFVGGLISKDVFPRALDQPMFHVLGIRSTMMQGVTGDKSTSTLQSVNVRSDLSATIAIGFRKHRSTHGDTWHTPNAR